ncbi:MAG: radical SAM protein [Elusimicrobiota bacterium]
MRIGLVYPPAKNRNNECFPLPSGSLAVLAGGLRRAGHEVLFFDFDIRFHAKLRDARLREVLGVLTGRETVPDYLRGELPAGEAAKVRRVKRMILGSLPLERCDLYGITLADLMKDLFLLNSAALIAEEIRNSVHAPVVLGNDGLPKDAYRDILGRYPVFNYATWSSRGESALLRLLDQLRGREGRLIQTLVRDDVSIKEYTALPPMTTCTSPDYAGYPLEEYKVGAESLSQRYDIDFRLLRALGSSPAGRRAQLIVLYNFESTCRGRCAFCTTGGAEVTDRKNAEEIVDDLLALKKLGVTGVFFINPSFNNDYDFTDTLCDRMIEADLDLQWTDCANFRELDETLLRKMRRAGAVKLVFGMETASDRLLKYIRKGVTRNRIERYLQLSHELGIWNHIELIAGFPTETDEDVRETVAFIRRNAPRVETYALNAFYLYPGAPFYREAAAFGIRPHLEGPAVQDYFATDAGVGNISEKFDEIGGLGWPEKSLQIRGAARAVSGAIAEVSSFGAIDHDHIHLLLYLYRLLGHSNKETIRRIFKRCVRRFKPYHTADFYTCDRFHKLDYVRYAQAADGPREGCTA